MRSPARKLLIVAAGLGLLATASPAWASAGARLHRSPIAGGNRRVGGAGADGPPGPDRGGPTRRPQTRVPSRCPPPGARCRHAAVGAHADRQHREGLQRWRRALPGGSGRHVASTTRSATSFPGPTRTGTPVTFAQALHHTSGIPDVLDSDGLHRRGHRQPSRSPRAPDLLSYLEARRPALPAGHAYEYSTSDNIVVGLMGQGRDGRAIRAVAGPPRDRAAGTGEHHPSARCSDAPAVHARLPVEGPSSPR